MAFCRCIAPGYAWHIIFTKIRKSHLRIWLPGGFLWNFNLCYVDSDWSLFIFSVAMVLLGFNLLCKFIGEVESYGRTAAGVAHKSDSDGNEWQGEQLAHVECHPYFECFLWVFDEFDKEAACKQGYEKHSEQEPRAFFGVAFPVHPHQQGEQCEVATGFVELCRVRWGCEFAAIPTNEGT